MSYDPTPVRDAEVQVVLSVLRRYASGVIRHQLASMCGLPERRMRHVVHHIRAKAIAPVVTIDSVVHGKRVYKIAQSDDEIDRAIRECSSRIAALDAARDGLEHLRRYGPRQRQEPMLRPEAS